MSIRKLMQNISVRFHTGAELGVTITVPTQHTLNLITANFLWDDAVGREGKAPERRLKSCFQTAAIPLC
jgi:hypothetical protein